MTDMNMSGMSSGGSSSSDTSSGMSMVFTNGQNMPLFSSGWVPKSTAGYAATCIFLVALAIISRSLHAYRHVQELKWHDKAVSRRYVQVAGETEADREQQTIGLGGEKSEEATLTAKGLDERVKVVRMPRHKVETPPWRFSTDLPRACIFVVQAGVGYLLMLSVMTLNVGYFLSVLAGLFVGELAVGRYSSIDDGHH
ncbi:Hypothetical protein R9X50_00057800 [Acrodontium crateriforme]|uniref:Copper transport protein n=1 Tax=Acrodontium crateriforme TaxID=150365 RepID=A0AAQ3LY44_9PEZI|nr:Hypothetical protein R9X50_00057800 [Acrodontium crateriforme]